MDVLRNGGDPAEVADIIINFNDKSIACLRKLVILAGMSRLVCSLCLVFSVQLNSAPVEAGVILTADSASVSDTNPLHEQPRPDNSEPAVQFDNLLGMSGNAGASPVSPSIVGLSLECVGIDSSAELCWGCAIENSVLPSPPLLDGLLKPA